MENDEWIGVSSNFDSEIHSMSVRLDAAGYGPRSTLIEAMAEIDDNIHSMRVQLDAAGYGPSSRLIEVMASISCHVHSMRESTGPDRG